MRTVQLVNFQENKIIGQTALESDYPSDPPVLIWRGRIFVAAPSYGEQSYVESKHLDLSDGAVIACAV
jgi:hypothetical protein